MLASTLQKKVGSNCPNCMMPKQLQLAFPANSFQANTAKLGMAFGRARPNVGRIRNVLRCFEVKENYSKT